MRKVGKMWILDDDEFFAKRFVQTGDKFDYAYLEYTLKLVKNFDTALDIGGHYGSWARPMSEKFHKVHTFEPRSDLYECLKKNTADYKNIHLHQMALGDRQGCVSMGVPKHIAAKVKDGNSGLATVMGDGNIPMTTVDTLFHSTDERIGLIKIDTEGYELHVLHGAKETLLKHKPVVIFEENSRCFDHNIQRGECGKYLVSLGAKLNKIFPGENHIYVWE